MPRSSRSSKCCVAYHTGRRAIRPRTSPCTKGSPPPSAGASLPPSRSRLTAETRRSEMRQAIQAMLVKMQCHSVTASPQLLRHQRQRSRRLLPRAERLNRPQVCFMRTCLERSGKPCCATDSELVRGAAASPGGQADEAGSPGTRSPSRHGGSEPRGGSHAASSTVRSPTSRSPGTRLSSSAGPWQPRPLRHDTGGWDHYMQQTQLAGRSGIAARTCVPPSAAPAPLAPSASRRRWGVVYRRFSASPLRLRLRLRLRQRLRLRLRLRAA